LGWFESGIHLNGGLLTLLYGAGVGLEMKKANERATAAVASLAKRTSKCKFRHRAADTREECIRAFGTCAHTSEVFDSHNHTGLVVLLIPNAKRTSSVLANFIVSKSTNPAGYLY